MSNGGILSPGTMLLARNQVGTREIAMGISLEITMGDQPGDYYGDQPGDYYGDQPGDYYGESAWRLLCLLLVHILELEPMGYSMLTLSPHS